MTLSISAFGWLTFFWIITFDVWFLSTRGKTANIFLLLVVLPFFLLVRGFRIRGRGPYSEHLLSFEKIAMQLQIWIFNCKERVYLHMMKKYHEISNNWSCTYIKKLASQLLFVNATFSVAAFALLPKVLRWHLSMFFVSFSKFFFLLSQGENGY